MRSRYTAYAIKAIDYLVETTLPGKRKYYSKKELQQWAEENKWLRLEIISSLPDMVEFKAYFLNPAGKIVVHHERSAFRKKGTKWYYVDGIFMEG